MWQINNEIDKLSAYKEKNILAEDVKEIVSNQSNETIFGLIDAIVSKNKKLSFQLLSKHFTAGAEPSFLLTMLIRQFKMLIRAKDLLDRRAGIDSVAQIGPLTEELACRLVGCNDGPSQIAELLEYQFDTIADDLLNLVDEEVDPVLVLRLMAGGSEHGPEEEPGNCGRIGWLYR